METAEDKAIQQDEPAFVASTSTTTDAPEDPEDQAINEASRDNAVEVPVRNAIKAPETEANEISSTTATVGEEVVEDPGTQGQVVDDIGSSNLHELQIHSPPAASKEVVMEEQAGASSGVSQNWQKNATIYARKTFSKLSSLMNRNNETMNEHREVPKVEAISSENRVPIVEPVQREDESPALQVSWEGSPNAACYQLQYSRDWRVKLWRTSSGAVSVSKQRRGCFTTQITGLEAGKAYVVRVRCGLNPKEWGEFGEPSAPATTLQSEKENPRSSFTRDSLTKLNFLSQRSGPDHLLLPQVPVIAQDADNVNHGLVVFWYGIEEGRNYQVQYARNHKVKVWHSWPEVLSSIPEEDSSLQDNSDIDFAAGLMQCRISGLDPGAEYVARVRCQNAEGTWGKYSTTSKPEKTLDTAASRERRRRISTTTKAAMATVSNAAGLAVAAGERAQKLVKASFFPPNKPFSINIHEEGPLGLEFSRSPDGIFSVSHITNSFPAADKLLVGDILLGINDVRFSKTFSLEEVNFHIREAENPRVLYFAHGHARTTTPSKSKPLQNKSLLSVDETTHFDVTAEAEDSRVEQM